MHAITIASDSYQIVTIASDSYQIVAIASDSYQIVAIASDSYQIHTFTSNCPNERRGRKLRRNRARGARHLEISRSRRGRDADLAQRAQR